MTSTTLSGAARHLNACAIECFASQALGFAILVLRLIMPRRDDRERSRTRHRRGRSESPPCKARRRNDRDDDLRQADSQDWLHSPMWQGSNGTASVPASHNHSMNYLHHAPALLALHPTIPRLDFLCRLTHVIVLLVSFLHTNLCQRRLHSRVLPTQFLSYAEHATRHFRL